MILAIDEPQEQRQDDADEDAGRDRKIKCTVRAPDMDVAGQPAEAESRDPRPQQADCRDRQADDDENASHSPDMDGSCEPQRVSLMGHERSNPDRWCLHSYLVILACAGVTKKKNWEPSVCFVPLAGSRCLTRSVIGHHRFRQDLIGAKIALDRNSLV
jgi:hypothetical protein